MHNYGLVKFTFNAYYMNGIDYNASSII